MYICRSHRRCGVGELLANAIVEQAWGGQCKFEEIKLNYLELLVGAIKLYTYSNTAQSKHLYIIMFTIA